MPLSKIETTKKTGNERFISNEIQLEFDLNEFWGWSSSELLGNTLRGVLAEFIVSKDVGCKEVVREEWDAFDLISPEGIKIEIKSSAYLQSWNQDKLSSISFGVQPTYGWDATLNKHDTEKRRQSDVYVFCLFFHKEKKTANPMNMDQWEFYVLSTELLNEIIPNQKSISLSKILTFKPEKVKYGEIHSAISGKQLTRSAT